MSESALTKVRIVLVEPAGPLNIGAIARVMKNMGLQQLVLVNPHCDPLGPEARQMAVHAVDLLTTAHVVPNLPTALQGCQRAIATTARSRTLETELEHPRTALPWLLPGVREVEETEPENSSDATLTDTWQSALIFGPEDRGLSNEELNYAQRFIRIPSSPTYPSLNLAQAVAVCCYELYQSIQISAELTGIPPIAPKPTALATPESSTTPVMAPLESLEGYYQQLETLLLKIGYLYPHTATSRMEKFRRLFNRAELSAAEVAMLRGILSQMEWALQQSQKYEEV
ncbi:RNA methyltransferase [Trichocoleus sp. FACHB-591]|uniref:RNA methyltransferase n=1 Tax=Trichocoleus sp. FACHB-591 TaxID=2692872 RepID=UPI00168760C9|nr:RNA methyltransferase [Trichocoleus sp. FACHB-591]MBD2098232.1 RNA methyltransferase [Trichocoleus sp. FACHB-591]